MRTICLALGALASVSGCTSHLAVTKIAPGGIADGYPYQLRFTQFELTLNWRVTACTPDGPNPLKLKISAEIKSAAALDPTQRYAIDPTSLQGPFRNTEFAMEWYEDRGTKSINSSVDDQTGTAIVDVLTGVAKLAAVGLVPFGATVKCSDAVVAALAAINGIKAAGDQPAKDGQEAITKKAQLAVDAQTLVLNRVTARAAALGANVDTATRDELGQAQRLLEALTATLTAEQVKLKKLVEVVSDEQTVKWPHNGNTFASDAAKPYRPSADAQQRWGMNATSLGADLFFGLRPAEGWEPTPVAADDGKSKTREEPVKRTGLPYREPQPMRIFVCRSAPCAADTASLDAADTTVKASEALVLQGGTMFYFPVHARTFANIKNSAGFAQSGHVTSAGTSQLRGAGSGAAAAFKGGAEQVAAIATGVRTAETAKITARADEAKALKALQDAEAALKTPAADPEKQAALAAFQADATLATAERTKIEAEAALALAKAQQAQ